MTQAELIAWLQGFIAAKPYSWTAEDFKRVRGVLDEAENAAKQPSAPPSPPNPVSPWEGLQHELKRQPVLPGCAVCNARGQSLQGYACPRSDCPTKVVCGGPT